MKEIILTQGQVALVNNRDYKKLSKYKWQAQKGGNTYYAVRSLAHNGKIRPKVWMHYEIMGKLPKGFEIDHKNCVGTDNRRKNLRFVTRRQNQQNLKCRKKTSKYPGVYWATRDRRWSTKIQINGINKWLGYFKVEEEAFEVYKQAVEAIGEEMLKGAKL